MAELREYGFCEPVVGDLATAELVGQDQVHRLDGQQVWADRILDSTDQTEDPIHLMQVFGLSSTIAVKYVRAAHPEKFIAEPTQP